jgi:hypothetical protein
MPGLAWPPRRRAGPGRPWILLEVDLDDVFGVVDVLVQPFELLLEPVLLGLHALFDLAHPRELFLLFGAQPVDLVVSHHGEYWGATYAPPSGQDHIPDASGRGTTP